jgi:YidC/Oxa1 family membrane protein insertase
MRRRVRGPAIFLAATLLTFLPQTAFAIPSPDLAINFFASAAQILGLATMVMGGAVLGRRGKGGVALRGGQRFGQSLGWIFAAVAALFVASLVINVLQWAGNVDDKNRRLQANLIRPSIEAGKSVGDVSLKTLSFSQQIDHPQGISTDQLADLIAKAGARGAQDINFIDLREPEERETGRLEAFSHIRYPDFPLVQNSLNLEGKTNVLLCYSGNRSSETCEKLAAQGIDCSFVVGGFEKWLTEDRNVDSQKTFGSAELRALPGYANADTLLDTPEVSEMVAEEGAVFVDVRYPGDFELGHLPGAVNLPIRKMPSAEMASRIDALPRSPVIAPCYDKRSCFYAKILGLRLDRLGFDFRGRYTVPHEFFLPGKVRAHVADWSAGQDNSLLSVISRPLERLLVAIDERVGYLPISILLVVLLLRLIVLPFVAKAERDQIVQRGLADEIAGLKQRLGGDPTRLSRATMALFRKHRLTPGRNMLGICIQIPLFLAFFFAVNNVAATSGDSFLWIPSLAERDPLFILPVALGALIFLHLQLAATKQSLTRLAGRTLAGVLLAAICLQLNGAVNLYLVLSIALMVGQTQTVRVMMNRRRGAVLAQPEQSAPQVAHETGILPLAAAAYVPGVGNKAARLSEMMKAGLPVPDGFVITGAALADHASGREEASEVWRRIDSLWRRIDADKVAVRSSGVSEDGEDQSYAGVFESLLNVTRDGLSDAIGEVRRSFASETAKIYGGKGDEGGAVLVQNMVDAEYAGVLFTEHPTESGTTLVEMVTGLGDSVADGTATPDAYRFGRYSGTLLDEQGAPIDLKELIVLGRRAEEYFGAPQDIEWAYRDGRFLILQSRNITAMTRAESTDRPDTLFERERERLLRLAKDAAPQEAVFVQNELSELLPVPTPFSLSFMEALWQPGGSTDLACRALRIPFDADENAPPYVTTVFGGLYINKREEQARFRRGTGFLTTLRLTRSAEALEREFREDFLPEFLNEIRVYEAIDFARLNTEELFALFERVTKRAIQINYVQANIINIAANFYLNIAEQRLQKRGLVPAKYLANLPKTVVSEAMSLLPEIRDGRRSLDDFMAIFGHRAPVDYEFAQARYGEDPALAKELVANALPGISAPASAVNEADILDDAALALCVQRAGTFQALKEEAKHHCLREFAVIRRFLVELDRRLSLHGGIFQLTLQEVPRLRQASFLAQAPSLIGERKAEAAVFGELGSLPTELSLVQLEQLRANGTTSSANGVNGVLKGNLVAGQAPIQGRARVVTDSGIDLLEDGEILITRFIHPSWAPMFPRVGGVVTEVGGWLSHAAILAREYNIPTIVGARGALDHIATGDEVRLYPDGSIEGV